ncbi:hypothetical protein [Ferrovibrio xuzhouensis]|uniref:Phage baseplate protein n=1 Tax=Ferrovibrio xuzhouensis TaxID=1576914 RepID=A0ABV7VL01_9PROT
MQGLTARQLLEVWEQGEVRHPLDRALMILSAAAGLQATSATWGSLADLSIGERNHRLLELRAATFGPAIAVATACPACGMPLEFTIDSRMLVEAAPPAEAKPLRLQSDGLDLVLRLPTSRDLASLVQDAGMAGDPRDRLVRRCVVDGMTPDDPPALSEDVLRALSALLAEADPLADILFALSCPKCEQQSHQPLDVAAFFWAEIVAQARRILAEVDALARVYHWPEADILALEPRRRQAYLERVLS